MTVHPSHDKIDCPFCGKEITFPNSNLGKLSACPHCNQDITLDRPQSNQSWAPVKAVANPREDLGTKIVLGYVSAFFLPIVGFFLGLYPILKMETGHGVCCMAISIIACWLAL